MNRVRAVVRAIEHEIERQIAVVESGERVVQETRGWDDGKGVTIPQRSKEEAHDYRFFPEPDIPPLVITEEWIDSTQAKMPELPIARKDRFVDEWGLNEYDADLLTAVRSTADYFEEVCAGVKASTADVKKAYAKEAANWLNGEMARMMNNDEISDMSQTRVKPAALATLVEKFRKRELNNNSAKQVFEVMYTKGTDPETVIKDLGLGMVSGADSLGPVVDEVIENNEKAVVDFLAGKEASLKFLMGQVMKATRGQADAAQANEMIREKLATRR
jgi:aspartyl-tRNA(Asn)/glutamyl-tRNA(Gln) amidotransferase subunit B